MLQTLSRGAAGHCRQRARHPYGRRPARRTEQANGPCRQPKPAAARKSQIADRISPVDTATVLQRHGLGQCLLEAHLVAVGSQRGPGGKPLGDADVAVQHHRRTGQNVEVVAEEAQIRGTQTVELQEVFANQLATVVQRHRSKIVGAGLDFDL